MKLLQDIIDAALDEGASLASLLRKCLVLADDLENAKLRDWCSLELNGYGKDAELPPYRQFLAESAGALYGPMGAVINDQPLSMTVIEQEHWPTLMNADFHQGISEISALAAANRKLMSPWPAHLIVRYQLSFIEGWALNRAWKIIPKEWPIGICDTVRTRILQFALELRKATGNAASPLERMSAKEVESRVTNIFYGNNNIVSSTVQGSVAQGGQVAVVQGDFSTLSHSLRGIGVPEADVADLQDALVRDGNTLGNCVKAWIARVGGAIGGGAATQVLTAAVLAFLGLS